MSENANAIEKNRRESVPETPANRSGGFEARIREYTTKELERGRKSLPPERFEKLVSEVARAWKNLMEERGRIISESRMSNDGTSEETALRDLVKRTVGAHGMANPESDGAVKRETPDKNEASDARGFRVSHGKDGKIGAAPEMKAKYEAFMFGGQSFAELSNADIGHVLSYAYSQSREGAEGNPQALEQLKTKLANDPRGLVTIAENWTHSKRGGRSIDRLLQIKANSVSVVKEIRSAFETAISGRVDQYVQESVPNARDPEGLKRAILDNVRNLPVNDHFFVGIGKAVRNALRNTGNPLPDDHREELRFVSDIFLLKTGSSRMAVAENSGKDPAFGAEISALSQIADKKAATAEKQRLEKKYAGQADKLQAISQAFGLAAAASVGTEEFLKSQDVSAPMSQEAARVITIAAADPSLRTGDTERRIREDRATTAELETYRERLAELWGFPKTKRAEDYSSSELAEIAKIVEKEGSPADVPLLRAIGRHSVANTEVRREAVALAAGISYAEVVRMEKSGADLGKLYDAAAGSDPYASDRAPVLLSLRSAMSDAVAGRTADTGFSIREGYEIASTMPVGSVVRMDVGSGSEELSYVKTDNGKYRIEISGKPVYECGENDLSARLELAGLLCEAEIPFLAGISEDLLRVASLRKGEKTEAGKGGFADWKKSELLSVAGELLGISGISPKEDSVRDTIGKFRNYAENSGSSLVRLAMRRGVLDEGGKLRNWESVREVLEK